MSMIETAVVGSKRIENLLKSGFHAEGRGLHECLSSVQHRIPPDVMSQARYIASVRNRVVHEDGVIDDISSFCNTIDYIISRLDSLIRLDKELAREKICQQSSEDKETLPQKTEDIENLTSVSKILLVSVTAVALLSIIVNFSSGKLVCDEDGLAQTISSTAPPSSHKESQLKRDVQIRDAMLLDLRKQLISLKQKNEKLCDIYRLSKVQKSDEC